MLVSVACGQGASRRKAFLGLQWFSHLLFAGATFVAAVYFFSSVKTPIALGLGLLVTAGLILAGIVRLAWGDASGRSASERIADNWTWTLASSSTPASTIVFVDAGSLGRT